MDTNLASPVADALAGLRYEDRAILSMTFVEGLNASEIAKRLNMNPSTVRTRKERLLKSLQRNEQLRALFEPAPDELADVFEEAATYTPGLEDF